MTKVFWKDKRLHLVMDTEYGHGSYLSHASEEKAWHLSLTYFWSNHLKWNEWNQG